MRYYFFIQSGPLGLYRDLYREKDVHFYAIDRMLNPSITTKAMRIAARWIDRIIKTNLRGKFDYRSIPLDANTCVLIESGFLRRIDEAFLNRIIESDAKFCLLLIDSMSAESPDLLLAKERINRIQWSDVYTIDKEDANTFGWNYIGLNYYSRPTVTSVKNDLDVYFVGGLKGNREGLLLELYDYLEKNGVRAKFDLFCYNEKQYSDKMTGPGLTYYVEWQPYDKLLEDIAGTNCIIEILQENQSCQSIRYFEAVALNKKLLTNNKHIFELPFYDPRYMKYFEHVEDVDIEWILDRGKVDYHYQGEFSPKTLMKMIRENCGD